MYAARNNLVQMVHFYDIFYQNVYPIKCLETTKSFIIFTIWHSQAMRIYNLLEIKRYSKK